MEFQELASLDMGVLIGSAFLTALSVVIVFAVILTSVDGNYIFNLRSLSLLVVAVAIFGAIASFSWANTHINNATSGNSEKFVGNLKAKYEISEVVTYNGETDLSNASNWLSSNPSEIDVKTNEGDVFRFLVTVDPDTFEPTLTNPPVNGGSAVTKNLGADDLLKIK